jgi:hypothetical protein
MVTIGRPQLAQGSSEGPELDELGRVVKAFSLNEERPPFQD